MQPVTEVLADTTEMLHLMITVQNHLYNFSYIKNISYSFSHTYF
jgi:hypothetical protein